MHPKVKAGRQTRICRSQCHKNLNVTKISMSQKSQCHRNASQSTDALNAMQCIPKSKQGSKQAPTKNCRSQCHKNMNITKISMSLKCIVMLSMHPKVIAGRGKQAPTKNCRSQCHNLQLWRVNMAKKNHLLLALQFTYLYTESDLCHEFVINLFVQHFLHTKMHCQLLQELFWSWYPTIYPTTATLAIFTQPNVTILTLGTLRYHSEYTHLPGGNFSHCYIYTFHLL